MRKNTIYKSHLFTLTFEQNCSAVDLCMQMNIGTVNTKDLPHTYSLLQRTFPSVLQTQCFNEQHLPFCEEVKRTEIGHLFEHIILDAFCLEKLKAGIDTVSCSGETSWNWELERTGTFHIRIESGQDDQSFIRQAIAKAIQILEELFTQTKTNKQSFDCLPVSAYSVV